MDRRIVPEAELKLVILYTLRKLGPVTSMQLLQFLVEEDLMNYFDMQLNLCELQEQGQIDEVTHPIGTLLAANAAGDFTLDSFGNRIPASRRQHIDSVAAAWRRQFMNEQQTPADSFPRTDGCLCVRLRLLEGNTPLVDMLLTMPEGGHIPCLAERWRSAAQIVYAALTDTLSDGFLEIDLPQNLPDGIELHQLADDDWRLSLAGQADGIAASMVMSLPDEEMARHYAYRWPENSEALIRLVCQQILTKPQQEA